MPGFGPIDRECVEGNKDILSQARDMASVRTLGVQNDEYFEIRIVHCENQVFGKVQVHVILYRSTASKVNDVSGGRIPSTNQRQAISQHT